MMSRKDVSICLTVRRSLVWLVILQLLLLISPVAAQEPSGKQLEPSLKRAPYVRSGEQTLPTKDRANLIEDFEAGAMPPPGWTHVQTNPNETWFTNTGMPFSGSYYAGIFYDPALLDQDEVLLSPSFTADTGSVSLWSYGSLYWCRDTYDNCDLEVWFVNGNWDGGGGDDVLLGRADDHWTDTWTWSESTFDFSVYASGNPARIAFRYTGNDGAEIGLDQIDIAHFSSVTCSDPHEINDTPGQATLISYGTTLTDPEICPAADEDYYAFDGQAGDEIVVDIDAMINGSLLDSVLHLYDTDGVTELAANDDYNGLDSHLEYTLPADGTYYFKVRDYGTPHGGPQYYYDLSLDLRAAGSWTFMVYLDGDNNLEGAAIDDFLEMADVGSNNDVNILVQLDRLPGFDSTYGDWTTTKRFRVTSGMTPLSGNAIQDIGEANMGDPQTLIDFVQWGMSAYPADHYAVVLWDHGSGWRRDPEEKPLLKDVAFDDTSGGDALDMPELAASLDVLSNGGLEPLDLVGFDACLMGMIEVDDQLIPFAEVRVGSEETEPYDGWPYDTILSALVADPGMSAAQLGTVIVDEYYVSYSNNQTQSAVNLNAPYDTLNTAVDDFALVLIDGVATYHSQYEVARANAQEFYHPTYIDLYDFAAQIDQLVNDPALDAAATAVMNATDGAVIRNQHGGAWPGAHGISIYFPATSGGYDTTYDGSTGWLQFTADTHWDEWLHTFYNPTTVPGVDIPWADDMEAGLNGWTADGFWHQVGPGNPYLESHSLSHSWWYGQDATGNYENGVSNWGSLTSPPINIPGDATDPSLSFWSWYETEPMFTPQSIYFDVYHDSDGDDTITAGGVYEAWANALTNAGYTISQYNQPIDLTTLGGHQVLAIFDPEISFSSAEITAINAFMQDGGRVVALGEWSDLDGANTVLNDLTAPHDITLNSDVVTDNTDNDGLNLWPLITNFADEPIVKGMNTIVPYASCSLAVGGAATPLASGDDDAYLDVGRKDEAGGDNPEMGFDLPAQRPADGLSPDRSAEFPGRGFDQQPPARDLIPGAPVVMAYAPVGAGTLIVIGDSSLWSNDDPDNDGLLALDEYDNMSLAYRVFGSLVDTPYYDQKWVQISQNGGPFQNLVQVTGKPMNTWHPVTVDLSAYVGNQVRLRFYFDTLDEILNDYRGWYIDDLFVGADGGPELALHGMDIDDDNNGESVGDADGIAEPGETIELYVDLINNGVSTATNVEACISEDSPYVNGFLYNTCSSYGNISPDAIAINGDDFDFTIASTCPIGHEIPFDLVATADNGGSWNISFTVSCGAGEVGPIEYLPPPIIDDDVTDQSIGNDNGQINPGEKIELYIEAGNTGLVEALNVQGCLSEDSPYVSGFLYNTCSGYGNILPGDTALSTDDFDFEVLPTAPDGHPIPFCIEFSAVNSSDTWTRCFQIAVHDSTGVAISVEPPDQTVSLSGGSFPVDIEVQGVPADGLGAFQFDLFYNPDFLSIPDAGAVVLGDFLGSSGCDLTEAHSLDDSAGRLTYGGALVGSCANPPSGDGVLATINFTPLAAGESDLVVDGPILLYPDATPIAATPALHNGHVTIADYFFADVNWDDQVNIQDILLIAIHWGCDVGEACYDPIYDLNNNASIGGSDLQIAACYFGWPTGDFSTCYAPTTLALQEGEAAQQPAMVWLTPPRLTANSPGQVIVVTLSVTEAVNLGAFDFELHFNSDQIEVNDVELSDFLSSTSRPTYEGLNEIDNVLGTVVYQAGTLGPSPAGPDGHGNLAEITITTREAGPIDLDLPVINLQEISGADYPVVMAQPDLAIAKVADLEAVMPGSLLTYTLTVSNQSQLAAATGLTITDTLPDQTNFATASAGGVSDGTQIRWTDQVLDPGAALTLTVTVTIDRPFSGTEVTNTIYGATSAEGAAAVGIPVATRIIKPELAISKVTTPKEVTAGSLLTYTLTVTNSGGDTATDVTVLDKIPVHTTFVSADNDGTQLDDQVQWTGQTLAVGETLVLKLVVQVDDDFEGQLLNNDYSVSCAEQITTSGATVVTQVNPGADDSKDYTYLPIIMAP